jgi:hypothetical protein
MRINKMAITVAATALTMGLSFSTVAQAASFKGYDFNTVGTATVLGNGDLQLTAGEGGSGAAWLTTALSTSQSFSSTFSFSLQSLDVFPMADGISFALQSGGTSELGFSGGYVAYGGLNAVGSVVQTWYNNTAGLNTDGNPYNTQAAPANLGIANLVLGTETVSYDATLKRLTMSGSLNVDGTTYSINDSVNIDLSATFGPSMYAGFTGSTGSSWSDQRITDFTISPVPEPESYAMLMAGLGLLGFVARRKSKARAASM